VTTFDEALLNDLDDETHEAITAFKERLTIAKAVADSLMRGLDDDTAVALFLGVYDRMQAFVGTSNLDPNGFARDPEEDE
jgi:hypothetical protein